ncbi:adenine nucleotide alpha hydrolases-like protein [Athelia psychrophila]|uniref:Adenine nucleotide alpha hydrolases-like protein n=1 Tax=Athelia psychrophila TaxID=1759441 RepID=A0A165ZY80_9AGAM|nr:adenine nucleotide alpha hydrolases-like protein [Fibularhizoctonia sp. CBS 109695]
MRPRLIACSKKLRHRAPDWSGCFIGKEGVLHERLAIVGVDTGAQPVASEEGKLILAVNGEIYNFLALRAQVPEYKFKTQSDCELILPLDICNLLDGMFSSKCPGAVFFASELKALVDACDKTISFPPGDVYDSHDQSTSRYFQPTLWDGDSGAPDATIPSTLANLTLIWETLEAAVRKRLMSEVHYGALLSGGLDNSLIAAIAARETEKVAQAKYELRKRRLEETTLAAWPLLHSFCIGLENSPDLLAARETAGYLSTVHHEYVITVQEGLYAIPEYHLETYDVTTVRASTPVYLLSRKIKAIGVRMVLSREGSDEILGGYLYFNAAPDRTSFHKECVKRVKNLHHVRLPASQQGCATDPSGRAVG